MLSVSPMDGDPGRGPGRTDVALGGANDMQRIIVSMVGAGLVILALAATVVAADPTPTPDPGVRARDTIPVVLGLTHEQVMAMRQDGRSLAQIAEAQNVDPQALVDVLVARWTERLQARVAVGTMTEEQAATFRAQLETQARDLVYKVTLGGMQGAAVGAGPGAGTGNGAMTRAGNGNGAMTRAGNGNGAMTRAGNGNGAMTRAGNGICEGSGPQRAGQQ
jgi:hypothetical protein